MPRKPALAVVRPDNGQRPPPPAGLSDRQAELWWAIVASRPADYFDASTLPLVHALVRHIETGEVLGRELQTLIAKRRTGAAWVRRLETLSKLHEREARAASSLATRLRLTMQARYTGGSAGTAARSIQGRPWDPENRFLTIAARKPAK